MLLALFVAGLIHVMLKSFAWPGIFYIGFPGIFIHLLIVGGHGGTYNQERIADILEIAVNTLVYAGLLWGLVKITKRRNRAKIADCHS